MPDPVSVRPDRSFLRSILAEGGEDLKKCFQCATCSVVCELSERDSPFPRKEMIWTQWGLKDRLAADPDIWLCHQCGDCSTRCPRGARPGDVLAAVRRQCVLHYSVPRFFAGWVDRSAFVPLLILIPAVLLGLAIWIRDPLGEALSVGEPHGFYAELIPHWLLIGFFSFFTGLTFLAVVIGVVRFWVAMRTSDKAAGRTAPAVGVVAGIVGVLKSILSHDKFGKCTTFGSRRTAHLAAFYGFVALFVVTIWAVIDLYVNPYVFNIDSMYPFALGHPMKILANIGCVALIFGCIKAISDRLKGGDDAGASTYFDWHFVWLLLFVGVSGLLTEIFRFTADPGGHATASTGRTTLEYTAFAVYFVHLVFVFGLLVYLPYSKFAHIVYRTVALVYAGQFRGK